MAKSVTLASSPLFVVRSAEQLSLTTAHRTGMRPDRPSSVRAVVDLSALVPQSGNLFVRPCWRGAIAMIQIALHRSLSRLSHVLMVRQWEQGRDRATDGKIKAPAVGRGHWLVGLGDLAMSVMARAGALAALSQ